MCCLEEKKTKKAYSRSSRTFWNSVFGLFPDHSSPWGVSGTSLSNNASRQFAATSVEVRHQIGRSSSTTTVSPPALLLPHLDHCNAQTGCRGQMSPMCPSWGRSDRLYRASREPGRDWRQEMMNDLLKKQPYPSTVCFCRTLSDKCSEITGSESKRSNLCQDKINTASFVHVRRQINPLADPGVTFRCGCQDVSASVQQPPVVAIIGWSQVDESEEREKGDGNKVTCQPLAVSPSSKTGTISKFNISCTALLLLAHTIPAQTIWIWTFPEFFFSAICCLSDLRSICMTSNLMSKKSQSESLFEVWSLKQSD